LAPLPRVGHDAVNVVACGGRLNRSRLIGADPISGRG
jgi:hypothetical protein